MRTFTKIFFLTVFSFMSMIALNAQTTVTWALTSSVSPDVTSGTGFTALNQTPGSGLTFSQFSASKAVNSAGVAVQTVRSTSTPSIPYGAIDLTSYEEYAVTAATGYKLTISGFSTNLAWASTQIYATLRYSTDDFTTYTEFAADVQLAAVTTSASTTAFTTESTSSLSVEVLEGSSFRLRVYPYQTSSATATGKYLANYNTTITFTATTTTGVNSSAASSLRTYSQDGNLVVEGADAGAGVQVYNLTGSMVKSFVTSGYSAIPLSKGLYLIKVGSKTSKVLVK